MLPKTLPYPPTLQQTASGYDWLAGAEDAPPVGVPPTPVQMPTPPTERVAVQQAQAVHDWLSAWHLDVFTEQFIENGYASMQSLMTLAADKEAIEKLVATCGMKKIQSNRLHKHLQALLELNQVPFGKTSLRLNSVELNHLPKFSPFAAVEADVGRGAERSPSSVEAGRGIAEPVSPQPISSWTQELRKNSRALLGRALSSNKLSAVSADPTPMNASAAPASKDALHGMAFTGPSLMQAAARDATTSCDLSPSPSSGRWRLPRAETTQTMRTISGEWF